MSKIAKSKKYMTKIGKNADKIPYIAYMQKSKCGKKEKCGAIKKFVAIAFANAISH